MVGAEGEPASSWRHHAHDPHMIKSSGFRRCSTVRSPFGNEEGQLGLGFGWIDPTAPNTNNEYVAETYYRMQLTPFVQVTADAMLTINPSKTGSSNEGVFSLRARGEF